MGDDPQTRAFEHNVLDEITRQDLLGAIEDFDRGVDHPFGPSTRYDILHEGKRYPPKAITGLAARRPLGRVLRPDEFPGGKGSRCFAALERNEFKIVAKDTFSAERSLPKDPGGSLWIE